LFQVVNGMTSSRISKTYTATEPDKFRGLWLVNSSAKLGQSRGHHYGLTWELAENAADEEEGTELVTKFRQVEYE